MNLRRDSSTRNDSGEAPIATSSTPTIDLVTDAPQSRRPWDSEGNEWHCHAVVYAHADYDGTDHSHILATDEDTRERLRRLLAHATRGPLIAEYRREVAELLELTH